MGGVIGDGARPAGTVHVDRHGCTPIKPLPHQTQIPAQAPHSAAPGPAPVRLNPALCGAVHAQIDLAGPCHVLSESGIVQASVQTKLYYSIPMSPAGRVRVTVCPCSGLSRPTGLGPIPVQRRTGPAAVLPESTRTCRLGPTPDPPACPGRHAPSLIPRTHEGALFPTF